MRFTIFAIVYIPRYIASAITQRLKSSPGKAVIIYGARQMGKTTLALRIIKELPFKALVVNADESKYIEVLSARDANKMRSLIDGYQLLFIDEAQRIPEVGINLKILVDHFPDLKLMVSGSSSFDLANRVSEPLTGRKWTYRLFPVSLLELKTLYTPFELTDKLEDLMIYGAYPEVLTTTNMQDKQLILSETGNSYLYKDVLELSQVRYPHKIRQLLRLLAFQVGSEVSLHEISNALELNRDTVERYIDLLEKSYVLFRLSAFSRNLRKEITKMDKIYFYDLGIRNMVIDNFNPLSSRNDVGALWENFVIAERMKFLSYNNIPCQRYFWRTYTGAELDYVEEREGNLYGFEIKYKKASHKTPASWKEHYSSLPARVIHRENFLAFLT